MGLFKKLSSLFSSPADHDAHAVWVSVRCRRCGEVIRSRVDLQNDLSLKDDQGSQTYFCRKILIGDQGCFQRIEVELTFDSQRRFLRHAVQGGEFIQVEEG